MIVHIYNPHAFCFKQIVALPPTFHRALYLMTKRNFKPPALQHRNKWSDNFHDFLRYTLQKDPRRRPTAMELLKVGTV